uniref:ROK family transcriptional regulator n=1 Tax=Eiseniibacteriota bacterium TaxID=2212470 RepID=A0A832MLC3_UNCEI
MARTHAKARREPPAGRGGRGGARRAAPARPSPLADSNLRLIWRERRISRAEIARRTGLARSTVSEIVGDLFPTGLIAEVGVGPSRGGRPPMVLEFRDDAYAILGVDMGAAHVAVALTDLRGRVLAWEERSHPVRTDPEGTRALIVELCDRCLKAWRPGVRRLVGIGVAVPSPVDPRHPDHLSEVVLPEWKGSSGLSVLAERYGVPLRVDNDANLGALAERWWGAGRDVEDFAYIKLATGVGLGHVIGGRIYRGATGVAGEIGHLAIDPHGGPCICGLRGCLATFVGAPALVARARALLDGRPDSTLAGREVTIEAIEDAALAGDALALSLVHEAAEHLGVAIAGLLNLMNPSLVVLGGGLARLGDTLLAPLRETVRTRTLISSLVACELRTSELGTRATAVGAATMVLEEALSDSRLFPAARGRRAR